MIFICHLCSRFLFFKGQNLTAVSCRNFCLEISSGFSLIRLRTQIRSLARWTTRVLSDIKYLTCFTCCCSSNRSSPLSCYKLGRGQGCSSDNLGSGHRSYSARSLCLVSDCCCYFLDCHSGGHTSCSDCLGQSSTNSLF